MARRSRHFGKHKFGKSWRLKTGERFRYGYYYSKSRKAPARTLYIYTTSQGWTRAGHDTQYKHRGKWRDVR